MTTKLRLLTRQNKIDQQGASIEFYQINENQEGSITKCLNLN